MVKPTTVQYKLQVSFVTNLPTPLTSFVGRKREIAKVKQLLTTTRLLTLTGVGGCGKTRLAIRLATDFADARTFKHGVCWVDLASLSDPTLVPQAIAKALAMPEVPKQPLIETLSNSLRAKHLLLVLDNCEHLASACAQLVETLLQASPNLKILATSRERLAVPGESAWLVPSLSMPDARQLSQQPQDLATTLPYYDAVRLFVERAASILPSFTLAEENAAAVLQVCQRLDGIPLALELAATRVNVLTVEQIAARLDDRFALLASGNRMAVIPRHQTLRAAIDWSYDLLSEQERALFQRLSVFAGGFTLEAAEAICSGKGVERGEILDLLSQLVDKSLVVAQTQERLEARYYLLETIRQYAHEKLVESAEEMSLRHRHSNWFLKLAEHAESESRGQQQLEWLDQLESEHDNFGAALTSSQYALSDQVEARLRLAGALAWFWNLRGYWHEGRGWLETLISRSDSAPSWLRAKALYGIAELAWREGDHIAARSHLEESVRMWEETLTQVKHAPVSSTSETERGAASRLAKRGLAYSMALLGTVSFEQGGSASVARQLLEEALNLFREVDDKWGTAFALNALGDIAIYQSNFALARDQLEEGLRLFREIGDRWGSAGNMNRLAMVALNQGNHDVARALLEEALPIHRAVGEKRFFALSLAQLGEVLRSQGDYEGARGFYAESLTLFRELGAQRSIASSLNNLGYVALYQRDYRQSATLFAEGLTLCRSVNDWRVVAPALDGVAGLAGRIGDESPVPGSRELELAARLFGAAQALLDPIGVVFAAGDRGDHERNLALVRARLDEAIFATEWKKGRMMPVEEAIREAIRFASQVQDQYRFIRALVAGAPRTILRITALGPAQVYRDGCALGSSDWVYAKAKELLFYLLFHPASTKEQIGLALWPDASPQQLHSNFRMAIYHLRRALGGRDWIVFENNSYTFNRSLNYWLDVEAFEAHIGEALKVQAEDAERAMHHLEEAVKLCRGELLEDVLSADWCLLRREELRRKYLQALLTFGQLLFAVSRYARAAEMYLQVIACDSYLEEAHRELMRCYARQGERGLALQHYHTLVQMMHDELGSSPAPETILVFERLQKGEDI